MSLPPNYKEGIERVTNIVSFVYPFNWTEWETRYKNWLRNNWIEEDKYLKGAQDMWTTVHECLEKHILNEWNDVDTSSDEFIEVKDEIEHWRKWINELWYEQIETEMYVREKYERFQWSVDLLYTDKEWKIVLADWKTYWIVKKRYDLPNKFIVATDKKKKVRLQMSIYAYALAQQWVKIDRLEILFLHEEGIKVIELSLYTDKEIEEILTNYENSKKVDEAPIIYNNKSKMIFEIRVPLEAYAYVNVTIDMYKEEEGVTIDQKIDDARGAIKHYLNWRANGG